MQNQKVKSVSAFGYLAIALVIYSCSPIFSKLASGHPMLSARFVLFYGMSIAVLGAYAVIWQQVLKQFELSVAYAAKPVSTILAMLWGVLLFHEQMTWNMVLGMLVILAGIWIVVTEHG